MERVAFIINPFSAKKNSASFIKKLERHIKDPLYHLSESKESTEIFIKENFSKVDVFVAVGGDGTISSVAKILVNTDKVLAVYPMGSGNGFAREVVPIWGIKGFVKKLNRKEVKEIDTFFVNGHLSINVSGVGLDSAVIKDFEKTRRGFFNYIKTTVKVFFEFCSVNIKFREEDFSMHDGRYLMLCIANTRQFGNNAFIAPEAFPDDGLLDLVLIKRPPVFYVPIFLYRLFTKKLKPDRYLTFIKLDKVCLNADLLYWQIDGELCRIESPAEIRINKKSLNVLV
ncbi:MAG: diacylglycerol kinase [Bergeyella sp.]|nr:diacylglycerol kinase [Bergeyella sp.]